MGPHLLGEFMGEIEERKLRHIRVSLEEEVEGDVGTGFKDVRLVHRALPEINLDDVSTETSIFGVKLKAPLIISAITGGTDKAKTINETLAKVAEEKGVGISVGSQRIAVVNPKTAHTFSVVRDHAPKTLIIGNLGCPQLSLGWGPDEVKICVEMVKANALAIHMNPLQEAIQVGGDPHYRGILDKIKEITNEVSTPIIMKETGAGIAYEEAIKLEKAGVAGLEISGVGGTSWSAVEYHIAKEVGEKEKEYLGQALWNWGIPTVISLIETSQSTNLKIIASGGIRTGSEIVKSLALGADMAGIAKPFLIQAVKSPKELGVYVDQIIQELRVVMFLVGARNVEELSRVPAIVIGKTSEWLRLRGFSPEELANRV